jgi:hypothetical protein
MLRAEDAAGQQLRHSRGAAGQLLRKAGKTATFREVAQRRAARRTRAVKIMTRYVADYQSPQSPTPLAENPRVLLEKTGAQ